MFLTAFLEGARRFAEPLYPEVLRWSGLAPAERKKILLQRFALHTLVRATVHAHVVVLPVGKGPLGDIGGVKQMFWSGDRAGK